MPDNESNSPARGQTRLPGDDLLWQQLKTLPAFRALLRSVEARFYRRLELPGPILDLGCGDGHFARMAFPDRQLEVGVDPWWNPLRKSRRQDTYGAAVQSLGDALPFPDRHFGSAISNSVLEHIPDVQAVLIETNRVLQPGGQLVITMPSHLFTQNLGGARYFGDAYRRFFNHISRHAHTEPPEWWAERLAWAGFRITRWQYYFSEAALHALEIGHVQGLPSAVLHFLTGHWIVGPWEENLRPVERWVRPLYEEPFPEEGAYLFMVAEKQAEGRLTPELPPAEPFELVELTEHSAPRRAVSASTSAPMVSSVLDVSPSPVGIDEQDATASATSWPVPFTERAAGESAPSDNRRGLLTVATLAAVALLGAMAGLRAINAEAATPASSLWIYGAAVLSFAGLVIFARRGRPAIRLPGLAQLPRRRWWYGAALLLAVVAGRIGGTTPYEGSAVPALLLWLAAIGVALYALWPAAVEPPETEPADAARVIAAPYALLIGGLLFLAALLIRGVALTSHPFVLNGVEASLGLDAVAVNDGLIRNPFSVGWLTNPTLPSYLAALSLRLFGQSVFAVRILPALVGSITVAALYLLGRRVWGEGTALVAAIFLAASHLHVHYSRVGMNNAWDPLLLFLPVALLALAIDRERRAIWLAAGTAAGVAFYFYTPSRLLPLILMAALGYLFFLQRERLIRQGRHVLAGAALALVIALPQLLFYAANDGVFTQRLDSVGILQSGWLAQETTITGLSTLDLLNRQFAAAIFGFVAGLDTSTTYNPGIPLLRFIPALLFTLGLGVALARFRRFGWAVLLIWVGVTVLFAGALLISPSDSHRLLSAMPAVCLLAAAPLVWAGRRLVEGRPSRQRYLLPALGLLAVLLIVGDLVFYFGTYREGGRFGDRNTEIAYGVATYLDSLEGMHTAYLHGPPAIYVDFPTIPFLATSFVPNVNLFNVDAPGAPLSETFVTDGDLIFLFVPERAGELGDIQARFPGGEAVTFSGTFADPLFLAYRVTP